MSVELPVRFYPTTFKWPLWCGPLTAIPALSRLRISDPNVKHITNVFDLKGLLRSYYIPDLPVAIDPEALYERLASITPVDGVEVVEWMLISAAENVVMQARILEYNRLLPSSSPQLIGKSGDAYIPGVVVEDIKFLSELGSTIRSRGYGIVQTPRGNFNVPSIGKRVGVFKDLITWGSISYTGGVQYTGNLLKWKGLAETPIRETVGFYMDMAKQVAPHFFVQKPARPEVTATIRQRFSSSGSQTININFRDPTDYSRVLGSKSFDVATGESEVTWTVTAFPYVPPLIVEIQPEDGVQTELMEYVVL